MLERKMIHKLISSSIDIMTLHNSITMLLLIILTLLLPPTCVVQGAQYAPLMEDNVSIRHDTLGRSDVAPIDWADSYSDGKSCYCASTFDHNIDVIIVDTPLGPMSVKDVCDLLGDGPRGMEGRPRYNDVQCGNGPSNDAGDEDECPGRTEYGIEGCKYIGPKWDFTPHVPSPTNKPTRPPWTSVPRKPPVKVPVNTSIRKPNTPNTPSMPAPVKQPIRVPMKAPLRTPIKVPVRPPIKVPLPAPIKVPARAPIKVPVRAPFKVPVRPPIKVPVRAPIKVPVPTPIKAPVQTPIKAPLRTPIKVPRRVPTTTKAPVKVPMSLSTRVTPVKVPNKLPLKVEVPMKTPIIQPLKNC